MHKEILTTAQQHPPTQSVQQKSALAKPGHSRPGHSRPGRSRRAILLTWLRKTHLYVGLWGAVAGLLFGGTGILLNHRSQMKIPVEKTIQSSAQLPLPAQGLASPDEMSKWLQRELQIRPANPPVLKTQPARAVIWGGHEVPQPERWTVTMNRPERGVNAEYFVGNRFVKLDLIDATPIGTLTRLHMSVGVSALWVLLADTIAGGLILLSITGLLLWTQLHTVRTAAVLTSIGALTAGLWLLWLM